MSVGIVYPDWGSPVGFIYGWVQTSDPGYRKVQIGASTYTVADGYQSFPDLVTAVNVAIAASGWSVSVSAAGVVSMAGPSAVVTWTDRLGWLLGFDAAAGEQEAAGAAVTALTARAPSPACVPLYHAGQSVVPRAQEEQLEIDRHGRGGGYRYGAADLWRWRIRLHRSGFDAFRTGWCRRGRVMLSPGTVAEHQAAAVAAWSAAAATGYVEGRAIGSEGGGWLDADGPRLLYEIDYLITAEVT